MDKLMPKQEEESKPEEEVELVDDQAEVEVKEVKLTKKIREEKLLRWMIQRHGERKARERLKAGLRN